MRTIIYSLLILALAFVACEDKDSAIKVPFNEIELNAGESVAIGASSDYDIIYKSENDYVAQVSKYGSLLGYKVGKTNILLNNGHESSKISVTVSPRYDMDTELYLQFGASPGTVMMRYGEPDSIVKDTYFFHDISNDILELNYDFESNKMSSVTAYINPDRLSHFRAYLEERYEKKNDSKEIYINSLLHDDPSMVVSLYVVARDTCRAIFMPN